MSLSLTLSIAQGLPTFARTPIEDDKICTKSILATLKNEEVNILAHLKPKWGTGLIWPVL